MTETIVLLLPQVCDANDLAAHWWRVAGASVVESGCDPQWRALAAPVNGAAGLPLVALAPVASVRLTVTEREGDTDRQRIGVARANSLSGSMADPSTLHTIAAPIGESITTAVVANGSMIEWLDWLAAGGVDPAAIVPAGLLLPASEQWTAAQLGSERMIGRGGIVVADEPPLREAFVGDDETVALAPEVVADRLVWLAQAQPLNLRSGRFARRRLFVMDWRRVRELATIAAIIPLLGLLMAVVMIIRLEHSSDRLDAETQRLAAATLGRQVSATAAASALDARISEVPGASGSPFLPLMAVYRHVQQVPGSNATSVSWRSDGTLNVSLSATRAEDLNRILYGLQQTGFRVTATSRAASNGQIVADVTVRSAA